TMRPVRAHWEVARRSFARLATYRAATVAAVFTNCVFGFVRAYILLAIVAGRPINGYDTQLTIAYVWALQSLIGPGWGGGWVDVADPVVSGDGAVDLARPIDFQGYWLAHDLGRAAYVGISRAVPTYLIGLAVFRLRLPDGPGRWLAFAISMVLAMLVSFALRVLVKLASFWAVGSRGAVTLGVALFGFLGGLVVPLNFLPDAMHRVLLFLPFASVIQIPIDVYLGRYQGVDLLGALALQAAWAFVILAAG